MPPASPSIQNINDKMPYFVDTGISAMNFEISYLAELGSTNETLSAMAASGEPSEGLVIHTGWQSHGKGHGSNSWISDPDKNLLFSVLLRPEFLPPAQQFDLSRMLSLAIHDLVSIYCSDCRIKWPNDIFSGDRKIAGILIENSLQGDRILYSIAGVGLNINQSSFDPAIPSPTSLGLEKGCHFDIQEVLGDLLERISRRYEALRAGDIETIRKDYGGVLYRKDLWADYGDVDGTFKGKILDVLPGGVLVVATETGEERKYGFKELEYLP